MKRKLTGPERALWLRGVISANIVMAAEITGDITVDDVHHVLPFLREKHPLLGVRLHIEEPDVYFVTDDVDDIPVREVRAESADCWQNEILHEMETPFDTTSNAPLVKSTLVFQEESVFVILCGHHTVCDGLALSFVLRDILYCLGGQEGKVVASKGVVFDNAMIPSQVTLSPLVKLGLSVVNPIFSTLIGPVKNPKKVTMPKTTLLFWEINKEQTGLLRKACKKNKVAEHSAITTLFQAAQYHLKGDDQKIYKQVYTPVSVRNKLHKKATNDFGMFASDATVPCPYDPKESFWENCRQVQAHLKSCISDDKVFGQILLANTVHPNLLDRVMLSRVNDTTLKSGFILSNLGQLPLPKRYGSFTLKGFRGPFGYIPHTEKSIAMVAFKGVINIVFGYRTSVISTEDVKRFKDKAVELLEEYTSESN